MIDLSKGFSRRQFIAQTSCFGAWYAVARLIPVPALAAELAGDSRVSQTPIVDKGFASVRKIGEGLYATISDPHHDLQRRIPRWQGHCLAPRGFRWPCWCDFSDGCTAHGQPGAGARRAGHPLPL